MGYVVKFQSPASYSNQMYGQNTIGKSACGCAAPANVLINNCGIDISVPAMCKIAVACGARVDGGTLENVLLNELCKRYPITYSTTSKNAELLEHLKAGGGAVCWCGGGYPLFSDSGHFVAAVGVDSNGKIIVADSLYYSGKWTYNSTRKAQISTTETTGLVKVSLTALGKATADRAPSYYLISKVETRNEERTTNDMTEAEVRTLISTIATETAKKTVSDWAADAFAAATDAGILDGTQPQAPLTREQFAVVLGKLGLVGTGGSATAIETVDGD